jgi:hypothetical protein
MRQMLHGGGDVFPAASAEGEDVPAPDFSLVDVNPTSPSSGQSVSPRDFQQQVTAWYYGSAL